MAIDADRSHPQEFSVVQVDDIYSQVKFYSPVPSWAQRRWDNTAEPFGSEGCLFSYRFARGDVSQEIDFISSKLWLVQKS
jgi:hypothetical protein